MKFEMALRLLGLSEWELSPDRIREAFAYEIKLAHPDTAAMGTLAPTVSTLQEAREVLLNRVNGADLACKQCHGTGKVRMTGSIAYRECGVCKGTGDKRE